MRKIRKLFDFLTYRSGHDLDEALESERTRATKRDADLDDMAQKVLEQSRQINALDAKVRARKTTGHP